MPERSKLCRRRNPHIGHPQTPNLLLWIYIITPEAQARAVHLNRTMNYLTAGKIVI